MSLEQIECSLEDIEADDYSLLQFIRKQKLKPPKSKIVPYVLAGHSLEGQVIVLCIAYGELKSFFG